MPDDFSAAAIDAVSAPGFKAGSGNAHHLCNRSDIRVVYLEIGDRSAGDAVTYPDDDVQIDQGPDGRLRVVRKNGSPF